MVKYRVRTVEIEAVQWDGRNLAYVLGFMGKRLDTPNTEAERRAFLSLETSYRTNGFGIDTLDGTKLAYVGDWIIKGLLGDYYPCKPKEFEMKYEQI